jgi:Diacylglycerol kinase catalytic domain
MSPAVTDVRIESVRQLMAVHETNAAASRRIGLIINPRSHANKADPVQMDAVLARHPEISRASPANAAALHEVLRTFASDKIEILVISGGDGTVRDVLSALATSDFSSLPEIAILSAGNTNLAGRVLGSPGHGERALEKLIAAITNNLTRRRTCPILQVSWIGEPARTAVCGFLFGAAAFTEAKRIAAESIERRGIHQGLAVAVAFAATVVKALFGRGRTMSGGVQMEVCIDGGSPDGARRFLMLATTLDSLMLGLWPFWGHGRGGIRWLNIDAPPLRLSAALWAVLLRRPREWMARSGYRSGRADSLRIRMEKPFILDGEAFDAGSDGILLSAPFSVTVITA